MVATPKQADSSAADRHLEGEVYTGATVCAVLSVSVWVSYYTGGAMVESQTNAEAIESGPFPGRESERLRFPGRRQQRVVAIRRSRASAWCAENTVLIFFARSPYQFGLWSES